MYSLQVQVQYSKIQVVVGGREKMHKEVRMGEKDCRSG